MTDDSRCWYVVTYPGPDEGPFTPAEIVARTKRFSDLYVRRQDETNSLPVWMLTEFEPLIPKRPAPRVKLAPAGRAADRDRHGQPTNRRLHHRSNVQKACDELTGICKTLLLDGEVTDDEAAYLHRWIYDRRELVNEWPLREIARRLDAVFADGAVTDAERRELRGVLEKVAGVCADTDGKGTRTSTRLPLDDPPPRIVFPERCFVITGKFVFGDRKAVEAAISSRGGALSPRVSTNVDFLLIGALASRDWKQGSHGLKIEKAVDYRERGAPISIIGEEHWAEALRA